MSYKSKFNQNYNQTLDTRTPKNAFKSSLLHSTLDHIGQQSFMKTQNNFGSSTLGRDINEDVQDRNLYSTARQIKKSLLLKENPNNDIFDIYNTAKQLTYTKMDMAKTHHVNMLSQALLNKNNEKTFNYAEEKRKQKLKLLAEMIKTNNDTKNEQFRQIHTQKLREDTERKMRGTIGRISKFTSPQVQEIVDLQHLKQAKSLQARRHYLDLQNQIQDKHIRDESDRVFLDKKHMAISGPIMKKINPEMYDKFGKATIDDLHDKEDFIDRECRKLNDIKLTQLFNPNELRGSRFKD